MKTLKLVLTCQWYLMIERGIKKEEYREIKIYWEKRLLDYERLKKYVIDNYAELKLKQIFFPHRVPLENACKAFPRGFTHVRFYLGYAKKRPSMTFKLDGISMEKGNPDWGAPKDKDVFIIKLGDRVE